MEITLQVPEPVTKALGYAQETLPRRALEALLIDECARGRLSRGKVAELLGLGFHDTEELSRGHRVPYPPEPSLAPRPAEPLAPGSSNPAPGPSADLTEASP
jgi:hypothetical protein